jgi:hypothetical protein
VRARAGRERFSIALSARFQEAIDSAAMLAGLYGSDDYTNGFTWSDPIDSEGTPQAVAERIAAEIETSTTVIDWRATARSAGSGKKGEDIPDSQIPDSK